MAEGYWNRQQSVLPSSGLNKRPRPDYGFAESIPPSGLSSGHEMHNYLPRDDDRGGLRSAKDTKTIGSAYDRYLQSAKAQSLTPGEAGSTYSGSGLGRAVGGGALGLMGDPPLLSRPGAAGPDLAPNGRTSFSGQRQVEAMPKQGRETVPLPSDASNTLYVEGLPPDTTKREVAHIFRPFVGYKEVRLVTKESKHRRGDPLILCFVDFLNPACAATAMSALQGYKMDEHDPDSVYLRLQFSRFGPRSSSGHGRR